MRNYAEAYAAAKDGSPFSNGTEGYAWTGMWCDTCTHDKGARDDSDPAGCPLLAVALMGRTPAEWIEQPWTPNGTWPDGTPRKDPPALGDTYHCTEYRHDPDTDEGGPDDDPPDPGPPPPDPAMPGQVDMFEVFTDQLVTEIQQAGAPARAGVL